MAIKNFIIAVICFICAASYAQSYQYNDAHFHVTNYIQEGLTLEEVLILMDKTGVGKMAVFGIPLQQKWNMYMEESVDKPVYYLNTGAKLYYYSAVDARIAREYLELPRHLQARFYPMITGFNPTDGYAVDHIKNMLFMYPGVFNGIGEFTINKEVVSSKITGAHATLTDPALSKVLKFAAKTGMVVILHSDIDSIQSANKNIHIAIYLDDMDKLFSKHKDTTIIWAHTGLGRYVKPRPNHLKEIDELLNKYPNLYVDISWDEVAKYIIKDEQSVLNWANLIKKHPTRFLFGTDTVAPTLAEYEATINTYQKLWKSLPDETAKLVKKENFERIFSEASKKIRAWEKQHIPNLTPTINWPFAS